LARRQMTDYNHNDQTPRPPNYPPPQPVPQAPAPLPQPEVPLHCHWARQVPLAQVQVPMALPPALPAPLVQDRVIINTVPQNVCWTTGIRCTTSAGWSYAAIKDTVARFEPQVRQQFGHDFWRCHEWQGLYTALTHKSLWNWQRCSKKTGGFELMLADYARRRQMKSPI
jgi:hypothetical protein